MKTHENNPSDNPSDVMICPRCKITQTIEHDGGQWCSRCGAFAIPPDPRHTAHIQTAQPRSPLVGSRAEAGTRADAPLCARCGGPGDTGDGIYDDGEWLCGGCIAGYVERADYI
ncbi:MAG TPA: hypothetical protein VJS64_13675 [Pyrinomonadaceae bacterium]|nr:hypothetical protein [Pyrinomonadaceae bacterium]